MEVAARRSSKRIFAGLGKCIENDAQLTDQTLKSWKATKEKGHCLFVPESGGCYDVFNARPLPEDIIEYCTQDVIHLPVLWKVYSQRLNKSWAKKAHDETLARLRLA